MGAGPIDRKKSRSARGRGISLRIANWSNSAAAARFRPAYTQLLLRLGGFAEIPLWKWNASMDRYWAGAFVWVAFASSCEVDWGGTWGELQGRQGHDAATIGHDPGLASAPKDSKL
jgi:hypothetical protein